MPDGASALIGAIAFIKFSTADSASCCCSGSSSKSKILFNWASNPWSSLNTLPFLNLNLPLPPLSSVS